MKKKKYRDFLKLLMSLVFLIIYIPHLLCFAFSKKKRLIISDLNVLKGKLSISLNIFLLLIFFLHNDTYFRVIFYHRLGPILKLLIGWYRGGFTTFIISSTTIIGKGFNHSHPYATILNAEYIGDNFNFRHCTTLGNKLNDNKRPFIGNNVTLGASVIIIGDIKIGNNVIIGAGSVVTKDIDDNSVVVGNPARVIRKLE